MAIILLVVSERERFDTRVACLATFCPLVVKSEILTLAAPRILSASCTLMSPTEYASLGLEITSTAPRSMASRANSPPSLVSELTIITGKGKCFINLPRNVRPSILGISISRVMTSGFKATIFSRATYGSGAVPMISISLSCDNSSLKTLRTTAESSTISTLIFFINPQYCWSRKKSVQSSQMAK